MKKKFLFLFRTAPYGSSLAREGIDALLTCAAYEQHISVLFMNDGVTLLMKDQQTEKLAVKNIEKMLGALALYDITDIYAASNSLARLSLTDSDLCLNVQTLVDTDIGTLLNHQDVILQF